MFSNIFFEKKLKIRLMECKCETEHKEVCANFIKMIIDELLKTIPVFQIKIINELPPSSG